MAQAKLQGSVNNSFPETVEDLRQPFVPEQHGLEADWRLTKFSDLKG